MATKATENYISGLKLGPIMSDMLTQAVADIVPGINSQKAVINGVIDYMNVIKAVMCIVTEGKHPVIIAKKSEETIATVLETASQDADWMRSVKRCRSLYAKLLLLGPNGKSSCDILDAYKNRYAELAQFLVYLLSTSIEETEK